MRTQLRQFRFSLHFRTASLIDPYVEDYPDLGIGDRGMNYFDRERVALYLDELGGEFDFIMHAIGDQVRDIIKVDV